MPHWTRLETEMEGTPCPVASSGTSSETVIRARNGRVMVGMWNPLMICGLCWPGERGRQDES